MRKVVEVHQGTRQMEDDGEVAAPLSLRSSSTPAAAQCKFSRAGDPVLPEIAALKADITGTRTSERKEVEMAKVLH